MNNQNSNDSDMAKVSKGPNNNNSKLIIGLVTGVLIGWLFIPYLTDYLVGNTQWVLHFFVTIFIVATLIYLTITWFKERIIKGIFGMDIEEKSLISDIQKASGTIIERIVKKYLPKSDQLEVEKTRRVFTGVVNYFLWSSFRGWGFRSLIAIFGIILTFLATVVAVQQNKLVESQNQLVGNQNKLFEQQNKRIDQQTNLQEAERRSSLVFLFSNIMESIDKELKEDYNKNGKRDLSPQLIGMIVALSQRLQPYRYLENDELTEYTLSPERGQLLLTLANSRLEPSTLAEILKAGNFESTELKGISLRNVTLEGGRFNNSYFSNVEFINVVFDSSTFENLMVYNGKFQNVIIQNSTVFNSRFEEIYSNGLTFFKSDIYNTEFLYFKNNQSYFSDIDKNTKISVIESIFRESSIVNGNFDNIDFYNTDLDSCILYFDADVLNLSGATLNTIIFDDISRKKMEALGKETDEKYKFYYTDWVGRINHLMSVHHVMLTCTEFRNESTFHTFFKIAPISVSAEYKFLPNTAITTSNISIKATRLRTRTGEVKVNSPDTTYASTDTTISYFSVPNSINLLDLNDESLKDLIMQVAFHLPDTSAIKSNYMKRLFEDRNKSGLSKALYFFIHGCNLSIMDSTNTQSRHELDLAIISMRPYQKKYPMLYRLIYGTGGLINLHFLLKKGKVREAKYIAKDLYKYEKNMLGSKVPSYEIRSVVEASLSKEEAKRFMQDIIDELNAND